MKEIIKEILPEFIYKLRLFVVSAATMYAASIAKIAAWQTGDIWPGKIVYIMISVLLSLTLIMYSFYLLWIEEGSYCVCIRMLDRAYVSLVMAIYDIVLLFIGPAYISIMMKIFGIILILILMRRLLSIA